VVVRRGLCVFGPNENRRPLDWRYSNHLTDAFAGSLFELILPREAPSPPAHRHAGHTVPSVDDPPVNADALDICPPSLRQTAPHVRLLLMDRGTLLAHRGQWGTEPQPTRRSPAAGGGQAPTRVAHLRHRWRP
jgi:hypothetical protein